jgi:hypothetical protein
MRTSSIDQEKLFPPPKLHISRFVCVPAGLILPAVSTRTQLSYKLIVNVALLYVTATNLR